VQRGHNRVLDRITLHVPVARAAPVFAHRFQGHRVAGSPELGRALEAFGAIPARHAHLYERGPSDVPPQVPPGVRLVPYDGRDLLDVYRAAGAEWDEPAIPAALDAAASALAVADRTAGAILVGQNGLIYDLFRDPAYPGTGKALIQHALSVRGLTLAVTDGNPAERLYQRLGFQHVYEAYSVDL
jgi:GNAT superfamily N-acetyltransferase